MANTRSARSCMRCLRNKPVNCGYTVSCVACANANNADRALCICVLLPYESASATSARRPINHPDNNRLINFPLHPTTSTRRIFTVPQTVISLCRSHIAATETRTKSIVYTYNMSARISTKYYPTPIRHIHYYCIFLVRADRETHFAPEMWKDVRNA